MLSWPRKLVVFSCIVAMLSCGLLFLLWTFTLVSVNLSLPLVFFLPVWLSSLPWLFPPVPHHGVYIWSVSPFVCCQFILSCVPKSQLRAIILSRIFCVCSMPVSSGFCTFLWYFVKPKYGWKSVSYQLILIITFNYFFFFFTYLK